MKNIFKLGTYIFKHRSILVLLFISLFLVSCSSDSKVMFLMKKIPETIEGIGDFFCVWGLLQISILILALLLSIIFGKVAIIISNIAHFFWIIAYRDYGFLMVTLLFFLNTIVIFLLKFIIVIYENKK